MNEKSNSTSKLAIALIVSALSVNNFTSALGVEIV